MDGFGEIGVFVRVVEARSFTRAGRQLGLTASGVSRVVSRLEARLGARLLDRTTRSLGLTADGAAYYERCTKILRDLEDANVTLSNARAAPRGRLRIDAPTGLARFALGPSMPRFLEMYPELSVDLTFRDHLVDPIAEGIDLVVRMAALRESELLHKKVGAVRLVVVGSPSYFARRGRPRVPEDLRRHALVGFLVGGVPLPWRFVEGGEEVSMSLAGRFHANSGDANIDAAVAGLGLTRSFEFRAREEIERGALEIVLRDFEVPPRPIYVLYARDKAKLPKVRVFLDFLVQMLKENGAGDGR